MKLKDAVSYAMDVALVQVVARDVIETTVMSLQKRTKFEHKCFQNTSVGVQNEPT